MAGVEIPIELKIDAKSIGKNADNLAKKLANKIESSLGGAFDSLGIGTEKKGKTGAASKTKDAISGGVAAGLAAGGVIGVLTMIADLLSGFPAVTAIMKLLKLFFFVLLYPLLPLFRKGMEAIAALVDFLMPISKEAEKGVQETIDKVSEGLKELGASEEVKSLGEFINNLDTADDSISKWTQNVQKSNELIEKVKPARTGDFVTDLYNEIITGFAKKLAQAQNIGNLLIDALFAQPLEASQKFAQLVIGHILLQIRDKIDAVNQIWKFISEEVITGTIDAVANIWDYVSGELFTGIINASEQVWKFIMTLFQGYIDVTSTLWNWFTSLFVGTINVATTVWDWFTGLFSGKGKKEENVEDAIITPSGVVHTDPSDFIIATKNPRSLGGGGNVTININNPTVSNDGDIKKLVRTIEQQLYKMQRRSNSYV